MDVEGTDPYDCCIFFFGYHLIVSFIVNSLLMKLKKLWIAMLLGVDN